MPELFKDVKEDGIMKKDSKSDAQKDYETARNKWARENAELFLDTLKMVAEKLDAELTPM